MIVIPLATKAPLFADFRTLMARPSSFFLPLLIFGVTAFNPITDDVTLDIAVRYLNSTLKFKQYVPAAITKEIEDIIKPENVDELQNLINLHNQFRKGELNITMPQTRAESLELMKKLAPKTFERCERLLKDFTDKYNSLSSEAKNFIDESERGYYKLLPKDQSTPPSIAEMFTSYIKYFVAQDAKFRALPSSVKAEFEKNWPELMRLYKSPMYSQMISIMKTANPKMIGTFVNKMMAMTHGEN